MITRRKRDKRIVTDCFSYGSSSSFSDAIWLSRKNLEGSGVDFKF